MQQRVSLKWVNQTSDSLTHTSDDLCNGNSPKCILTQVLNFSSDESDIILTTEEDNRLCRVANGDYGDDDDNENETAPPTAEGRQCGRVVRASDLKSVGRGFKSRSDR